MRKLTWMFVVPAAVLSVACGRSSSPALDDALKNDLALASQAQAYNPQQFVSPIEGGYAQQYAPRTVQTAARQPVGASYVYGPALERVELRWWFLSGAGADDDGEAHGRDAAIGAAAGAIIGATTSRDKVKGGLIGAAVGGILGAVIGNNVDVQKKIGLVVGCGLRSLPHLCERQQRR